MNKMLYVVIALVAIAVIMLPVAACEIREGCWLTAGGHITNQKDITADFKGSYGGNGMTMKDGSVRGEWNHVDHLSGDHFHGIVAALVCDYVPLYDGPNVPKAYPNHVVFVGEGRLNDVDGCTFEVDAYDIDEGGIHRDGYEIWVWCDGSLALHNKATEDQCDPLTSNPIGCLAGGNFQIHPANNGHPY